MEYISARTQSVLIFASDTTLDNATSVGEWKQFIVPVPPIKKLDGSGVEINRVFFIGFNNVQVNAPIYIDDIEFITSGVQMGITIPDNFGSKIPSMPFNLVTQMKGKVGLSFTFGSGRTVKLVDAAEVVNSNLSNKFENWFSTLDYELVGSGDTIIDNDAGTITPAEGIEECSIRAKYGTAVSNTMKIEVLPSNKKKKMKLIHTLAAETVDGVNIAAATSAGNGSFITPNAEGNQRASLFFYNSPGILLIRFTNPITLTDGSDTYTKIMFDIFSRTGTEYDPSEITIGVSSTLGVEGSLPDAMEILKGASAPTTTTTFTQTTLGAFNTITLNLADFGGFNGTTIKSIWFVRTKGQFALSNMYAVTGD
jgi:hypothetical protein